MRQVPATRVREAMLFLLRRPIWLALVIFGIVLGVGLSMYGSLALPGGISNVELNIGTGLLEALITVAIIGPIIAYIQEGRVREHPRLDHNWFLDRAKEARSRLQILTTYSDLLTDQENADRFLAVIRGALSKRANVEILLLNPDSLSAEQRQQELQASTDLQGGILHNLRRLHAFAGSLDARRKKYFTVRLYAASASIVFYRWDNRALVSFLLIGRLAERGAQLEVTTSSQLGEFVQERFNQLWDDKTTKTLERFMYLPVTITEDDRNERWEFAPSYVQVDGTSYVIASKEMLTVMARRRGGSLQAYLDRNPSIRYGFDVVDENEPELYGRLIKRFTQKYDTHADTFVGFTPLPATEPHPATEPLSS